jgi:hypothetical protein
MLRLVNLGHSITVDDNLERLLSFQKTFQNELKIQFKGNQNNKMYVEDTNLKSKLQCQGRCHKKAMQ